MGQAKELDEGPRRVGVHNLPFSVTKEILVELFSPFGAVTAAGIIPDPQGRGNSGRGYVEFASPEFAELAVKNLNNLPIGDRHIRVNITTAADLAPFIVCWGAIAVFKTILYSVFLGGLAGYA